jgi:hypothetical protein
MRVTQLLLLHLMLLLTAPTLLAQDTGSNSRSGKQPDSTAQALEMTEWMERIEKKLDDLLKSKGASNEPQKKIDLKKLEADSLRLLSKIDQIEKSNSDLRIQLAIEKSAASANKVEAQTRKTEAVELSKKHTEQLEGEIAAVTTMGEEVPDALLKSMLQRATELSPSNKTILDQFKSNVDLLREGRNVLEKAPDGKRNAVLSELRAGKMETFPELEKDRQDLMKLLEKYCQRSKDLANRITDAAGLSGERRTSFLEDARYLTKDCPYLKDQLEKALKDPSYQMPAPNCN